MVVRIIVKTYTTKVGQIEKSVIFSILSIVGKQ